MNRGGDSENNQPSNESAQFECAGAGADAGVAVVAATDAPNQQQCADILKLDIDCFDEAFDYLPLKDLFSVGRTCKRLYKVIGHILQQNFVGIDAVCYHRFPYFNGIRIGHCEETERFAEFLNKICVEDIYALTYFLKVQSKFRRLQQIEFGHIILDTSSVNDMKPILQNIKSLRLDWCGCEGSFDDAILAACPNLTHLYLSRQTKNSTIIGSGNDWLLKMHPKLVHFELFLEQTGYQVTPIQEIAKFLEMNPNITTFSIFEVCLMTNRESMLSSNIQLNEFNIFFSSGGWDFGVFCNLLNELHKRGFYKRLNLYYRSPTCQQSMIDQMASLNAVAKLSIICGYGQAIGLSAFNSIEALHFTASNQLIDLEAMATNLPKLERIHFSTGYVNHITLLISRAASLSKIIVTHLFDQIVGPIEVRRGALTRGDAKRRGLRIAPGKVNNETVIIQLAALNREREKLTRAQKITLYVEEEIYLATKWAMKETDLNLIRLKRREAYERENDFNINSYNRH